MPRSPLLLLFGLLILCTCSAKARGVYNADLGRWITRDPIGHADGANLYQFAHDDPMVRRDAYAVCATRTTSVPPRHAPPTWQSPPGMCGSLFPLPGDAACVNCCYDQAILN